MNRLIALAVLILATAPLAFASLETDVATGCRTFAQEQALRLAGNPNEVTLNHFDRCIPFGNLIGRNGEESEAYANAVVVVNVESSDPVQVEMLITGTRETNGKVKCTLSKKDIRPLLQ